MSSFLERRVFYVPGENSAIDEVMPDGKGRWGGRTLEETRIEHPDAVEISLREALSLIDTANRKKYNVGKPIEITREKWWYFLEVLPPDNWRTFPGDAERFMMIEYLSNNINGNITAWYVRIGDRYFCVNDYTTAPADAMLRACRQLI